MLLSSISLLLYLFISATIPGSTQAAPLGYLAGRDLDYQKASPTTSQDIHAPRVELEYREFTNVVQLKKRDRKKPQNPSKQQRQRQQKPKPKQKPHGNPRVTTGKPKTEATMRPPGGSTAAGAPSGEKIPLKNDFIATGGNPTVSQAKENRRPQTTLVAPASQPALASSGNQNSSRNNWREIGTKFIRVGSEIVQSPQGMRVVDAVTDAFAGAVADRVNRAIRGTADPNGAQASYSPGQASYPPPQASYSPPLVQGDMGGSQISGLPVPSQSQSDATLQPLGSM